MKRLYQNLIILTAVVAMVATSCQKEPCQKCLEAQRASKANAVEVSAALVGENYVAEGLTCPATMYVWNEKGFLLKLNSGDGKFTLDLPDGVYDFAVTVNVPDLLGTAVDDLRNSILTLPEREGIFLLGVSRDVEVRSSSSLMIPLSRSYPAQLNIKLF